MGRENGVFAVSAVALVALLGLALFLSGCPKIGDTERQDNLARYGSYSELVAQFSKARSSGYGGYYGGILDIAAPMAAEKSEGAAAGNSAQGVEYSATNVQVEGVDEADIIKTDGKYAYAISGNRLFIVEAFPAEEAGILSETSFSEENSIPLELFVLGDKLLLFSSQYSYDRDCVGSENGETQARCFGYGGVVQAKLYSIEDRENPKLEKEAEFEGSYLNSRLIGDTAYFIVNSYPRWPVYGIEELLASEFDESKNIIPMMRLDGIESRVARANEIGYVSNVPPSNFITIVSLNLGTGELNSETVTASGQTIYASQENLYIAAGVWSGIEELPVPLRTVGSIFIPGWGSVEKTSVSKFELSDGEIYFVGEGIVPGSILNQFSMDEFDSHFRIATTVGHVTRSGSESKNNVYVLDSEMNVVGALEDLAPGERIYSARFMGERGYLVTFKKVDPLFVLDLSDHENPKVLGKLKIPGYSDYLHPIDESHILGLGKETIEALKGNFAWYQGIKMAIFDVSDPENPVEMDKIVIGDRGTDSYALHDHKAFLFDREKELLVIPVTLAEIPEEQKKEDLEERLRPSYGEYVFQGAFVFNVSLEDGISEKGRITHVTAEDELKRGYMYSGDYSVKRSFYIDGVLYTFSDRTLKANDLDSLEEISTVDFGKPEYNGYPHYYE